MRFSKTKKEPKRLGRTLTADEWEEFEKVYDKVEIKERERSFEIKQIAKWQLQHHELELSAPLDEKKEGDECSEEQDFGNTLKIIQDECNNSKPHLHPSSDCIVVSK